MLPFFFLVCGLLKCKTFFFFLMNLLFVLKLLREHFKQKFPACELFANNLLKLSFTVHYL